MPTGGQLAERGLVGRLTGGRSDRLRLQDRTVSAGAFDLPGVVRAHGSLWTKCPEALPEGTQRTGAVVAANSVVLNDVDVPSGALAAGSPAVIKPGRADLTLIQRSAAAYVERIVGYRTGLRRLD